MTQWFRSADITGVTTLAAGAAILDQSISLVEPVTVMRIRGIVWVASDQSAANETQLGAVGAAVVTSQALAIGVTAVPTPITDKDSDAFMLHQYFGNRFVFGDATGFVTRAFERYEFDSKAMRKMPADHGLVFTVENASR